MELWERSTALAALEAALRATPVAGRVVLVAGEAGIGKSALVRAFAAACGSRARVWWGGCDPLITPRASGPLRDMARQAGGRLARLLAEEAGQADVFGALLDELSGPRQRTPRVLVVEDAHWADEATLDLLTFLGRRIERVPALLLVTYRDDELGAGHPLRPVLAALPRQVRRDVPLPPLSRRCVAARATPAGRDPDELYALTGGNPLLVTEVLEVGEAGAPATARDLILTRVDRLSPGAREVARLVAVVPGTSTAALLVGQQDEVDECVAAGVLTPRDGGVSYRHELLRRAVEESLSPVRRVTLHRRVLALMTDVADVDPARLAHHARFAGDVPALLRYATLAARAAHGHGAYREAVLHYRALAAHVDRLPARQRAELLEGYAVTAYLAGVSAEGLGAQRTALALREELGEREAVGENLRWVSRLAWWAGHGDQARAAARRAVEVLAGTPSRPLAMAYSNLSQLHMLGHELAEAVVWGKRAYRLARRLGDQDTATHALVNTASARMLGGDPSGPALLLRAHQDAARAGLVDHAARALVNRATTLVDLSDVGAAVPAVADALRYAHARGLDGYVQYLLGVRARVRLERGEWDDALADAAESLAMPTRSGVAVVPALVATGRILSARGDAGALPRLDEAAEHAYATGELQRIALVAAARAEHFLLVGEPARAAEEARTGLTLARPKGHRWFAGELAHLLWRATGAVEPVPDLPPPYRLLRDGDCRGAASAFARLGRDYARIEALSHGDPGAAGEALGALDALGAVRAAKVLRAGLRRRGVTGVPRGPRRSTTANPAGLTARQLEVLVLLAEGLTYTDIAGRLTLSPRTVERHVSAVLGKLGVATRGQAVAAAHRMRLVDQGPGPASGPD